MTLSRRNTNITLTNSKRKIACNIVNNKWTHTTLDFSDPTYPWDPSSTTSLSSTSYNKPLLLASRQYISFLGSPTWPSNKTALRYWDHPKFLSEFKQMLHTVWGPHQKAYLLLNIKSLTKKLGHIASMTLWIWFLPLNLYSLIAQCLYLH